MLWKDPLKTGEKWNCSWVCCFLSSDPFSRACSEGCFKIIPFNAASPLSLASLMSLILCSLISPLWLVFPHWSVSPDQFLLPAVPVGTRGSSPGLSVTVDSAYPPGRFASCLQLDCRLWLTSPDLSWQSVLLTTCWIVIATIPPNCYLKLDTESLPSLLRSFPQPRPHHLSFARYHFFLWCRFLCFLFLSLSSPHPVSDHISSNYVQQNACLTLISFYTILLP